MKQVKSNQNISKTSHSVASGKFQSVFRYPVIILGILVCLVYFRTLNLGFVHFDDSLFIEDNQALNRDISNVGEAFNRGLFRNSDNTYYRPVFLADIIIESRLFGTNPAGYHFTNLLFHLASVILLFFFLRRLLADKQASFLLAALFAVHPVLSQAVAWIPGRNDMLLFIFCISGLILTMDYCADGQPWKLVLQFVLFLLALLTKETAVLIPVAALLLLLIVQKTSWKRVLLPGITWAAAILVWFLMRSHALAQREGTELSAAIQTGISRLPAILQYFGKAFLPFNLNVFPYIRDTTLIWGILSLILVVLLLYFSKKLFSRLTLFGFAWFLVFISPVLIVPSFVNDNIFEHRIYLPIAGLLVVLSQTILFPGKRMDNRRLVIFCILILSFGITSFVRIGYFRDPVHFWSRAENDSPRSDYVKTELVKYTADINEQERLLLEVLLLKPQKPFTNLMLADIAIEKQDYGKAEQYLRAEMPLSNNPQTYFLMAQVFYSRNEIDSVISYTEKVIGIDPGNYAAYNNLALLYAQTGQGVKALGIIEVMRQKGMNIPEELLNLENELSSGQAK